MIAPLRVATALAVALPLLAPAGAAADPLPRDPPGGEELAEPVPPTERPIRVLSPATIVTDGGGRRRVPPGRYLAEPLWERLDLEVRRLQDAEARLAAENASLRADAGEGRGVIWWLAGALVAGAAGGWYLAR